MKKCKQILGIIMSVVFEHITLFATIIASVYIITSSQIEKYDSNTLLLWIIGLLGLIAIASVSEKYFKLTRIEKGVDEIQKSLHSTGRGLDNAAFTRKELKPLEERLSDARQLTITGGSLCRLSDEYYAFFEKKLKDGCTIEIIMVEPYSNAANLLCDNIVYETKDHEQYSTKILESLNRFLRLKSEYNASMSIRLTKNVPPFSIIVSDCKTSNACIKVELYSYAVPTRERIQFEVLKDDSKSFMFFSKQLDTLRKESQEIDEQYAYTIHNLANVGRSANGRS